MSYLVVTGTGTEIGKTIVTAAVAALAVAREDRVAVVKPVQTGVGPEEESDVETVSRLAGVEVVREVVRYAEPLAPATAARRQGVDATPVTDLVAAVREHGDHDLVLVEGAGGLLVRLDAAGATIADVATQLAAPVLVVTTAGLGSLNLAALTAEALRRRGLHCRGFVVGAWPADAGLAERTNLDDLPDYTGAPLLGVLPAGVGRLTPSEFLVVARSSLAPELGGTWRRTEPSP